MGNQLHTHASGRLTPGTLVIAATANHRHYGALSRWMESLSEQAAPMLLVILRSQRQARGSKNRSRPLQWQPISLTTKSIPATVVTEPTATVAALAATNNDSNNHVVRITQEEVNQKLRDIGTDQAKVTNVTLSKDSVAIDLLVGGIKGTLTTGLAVANGNIILAKPRLDGVIGALLPIEKISQLFEDEINKRLRDKTPVQELHIMDGVIEITLAGK